MKFVLFNARSLLVDCAIVVALHSVFLLWMERTGVIEKLMTGLVEQWELWMIVLFILIRLAAYLVVPPVVVGVLVASAVLWLARRRRRTMDSQRAP